MKTVLICGDRDWKSHLLIKDWLNQLTKMGFDTLIEGECKGADVIAREEAEKLGYTLLNRDKDTTGFPAERSKYHQRAEAVRNAEMIKVGKPDLVVAFHQKHTESGGTQNMINLSRSMNIPVILVSECSEDMP